MCWHEPSAPRRHAWRHPPYPGLTYLSSRPGLTRIDPKIWPSPNRLKLFFLKSEKKKCFDQTNLWLWPKSQNFQKGLVPFYFSRTFQFWYLFLCSRLGNCANCPNSKKLTFVQILTKKSKFSRRTYLAQFFAKILIFESISSFENPKLLKKCDSATVGFNVNLDQESRSSSKACPIQTFT